MKLTYSDLVGYLLLGVLMSVFLPIRNNFILVTLCLLGWILYFRLKSEKLKFNYLELSLTGLWILSIVSFVINNETSLINFGLFHVTFFAPFSLLLLSPLVTRKWKSRLMKTFIALMIIQILVVSYQFMSLSFSSGELVLESDSYRGTHYSAHHLSVFTFLFITVFLDRWKKIRIKCFWKKILLLGAVFVLFVTEFTILYVFVILFGLLMFGKISLSYILKTQFIIPKKYIFIFIIILLIGVLGTFATGIHDLGHRIQREASKLITTESSGGKIDNIIPADEVSYYNFLGLKVLDTSGLNQAELNKIRREEVIINTSNRIAQTLELLFSLPKEELHARFIGLGPGNVNSRAANFRSRPWRWGEEPPLIEGYASSYAKYYAVRWENPGIIDIWGIRSSTLEQPFGTWQMLYAELGIAGVVFFILFWILFLQYLFQGNKKSFGYYTAVYLMLVLSGVAFFINVAEYPDLIGAFIVSLIIISDSQKKEIINKS